jgi:hypothetical protein
VRRAQPHNVAGAPVTVHHPPGAGSRLYRRCGVLWRHSWLIDPLHGMSLGRIGDFKTARQAVDHGLRHRMGAGTVAGEQRIIRRI